MLGFVMEGHNFFLLSVFDSLLGSHNFYMGTQNGSKTRNLKEGFLIHAFELKLLHFNVFPCLYREAMHLQCFTPTLYVMGVATRAYKRDDFYTKLHYGCLHYAALLCM